MPAAGFRHAKTLHVPLVYVLNCSGVKFDEQEKVYPNRRGGGTPFFRNAELNQLGIPVIVGIYGRTLLAAVTTPSARPSSLPTKKPIWLLAAPESLAE